VTGAANRRSPERRVTAATVPATIPLVIGERRTLWIEVQRREHPIPRLNFRSGAGDRRYRVAQDPVPTAHARLAVTDVRSRSTSFIAVASRCSPFQAALKPLPTRRTAR
jgi:hypothetical protein